MGTPKENSIIQMFDQESPVFSDIPQDEIDGRIFEYSREAELPSIGWRAVNQAWGESTGRTVDFVEHLKIIGGEVKVDEFIVQTTRRGAMSELKKQTRMKVRAAANEYDRTFFEGSELVDTNEMVGLRSRITDSNQLLLMATGGGTLTLAKLDTLIESVPARLGRRVMYMNATLRIKVSQLIDAATGSRRIETERDEFGTISEFYGGVKIAKVEQIGDASTILGFDEDPGDGTADCASIYLVAFGDDAVHGIYNNGGGGRTINVTEFGVLESEPRYMIRFSGNYGMAIEQRRAAARLYGVTNS